MGSRKKQRTSQPQRNENVEKPILGSRSSRQNGKGPTQEELDLTASLFGTGRGLTSSASQQNKNAAKSAHKEADTEDSGGDEEFSEDESTGMEDVQDDQLFAFDTGAASQEEEDGDDEEDEGGSSESASDDQEDIPLEIGDDDEEEQAEAGPSRLAGQPDEAEPSTSSRRRRNKAVWTDPATAKMLIPLVGPNARAPDGSFAGTKRLRKLRQSKDEVEVSGKEYERRLREMYEKLHPRPAWASRSAIASAEKTTTEDAAPAATPDGGDVPSITNEDVKGGSSLADLLSRDTGLVARVTGHSSKAKLPQGDIEVERLRDASTGLDADLASAIECMEFHPSARSKILMTASRDRRVRLFQIDGSSNPLLQTLHVPSLPLSTATFHPSGTSLLLSGPRPYFYSYDLQSGRVLRSSPWRAVSGSGASNEEDIKERDLSRAKFQPLDSSGQSRMLAIGGRRGAIHLLDWASSGGGGGGSLISSLRQNSPVAGLEWDPSPDAQGRRLVSLSQEGTVSLWDVRNMRCEVIKRDVGLFGAQNISMSSGMGGNWTAVGSESGIVNMYDSSKHFQPPLSTTSSTTSREESIESIKSLGNLTTSSTTLQFNENGQILALASKNKKDALKLVHLPSCTVFQNWPTSGTPLGHVSDVAFSNNGSHYLAVGNTRGRVLVYGLKHFCT
ncbi:unnamed protein product [Sympodiomycopsis kandeliae]